MKSLAIGCVSIIVGLVIGIALMMVANVFLSERAASSQVYPTPQPGSTDVSITVSTAFLSAQMQQAFKQSNLARQSTFVYASPNIVRATMLVDLPGAGQSTQVSATVTMRVAAQNGRVALIIDRVDAGGVNVPQAILSQVTERVRVQVENQINQMIQRLVQGTTLRLMNIAVTPNDITAQFKAQ